LNKEKILENEIEIIANNMEIEKTKKEMTATKEILTFKEKQLDELIKILLERGCTLEEIEELTK
jgi:hypothetical protein